MAKKKSRKGRARKAPKMYPKGAPTSTSVKAGGPKQSVDEPSASTTRATATGKELREEYWYVYNDLKRIAMVAGTLLAVLIVLSFFIR
jgi:hypothetical protein